MGDQMITATFDDGMKLKFTVLPSSEVALNYYDKIPASGQVTIPSEITSNGNTYRVVRIGHSAFSGCDDMTSITIPNSVTGIGDYAFEDCTGLTSITIPKSVTDVGEYIFHYCTGLTNVNIPNGVTTIWDGTFDGCIGLTTITIPNSVTSIGEYAFNDCTGLTSITIPSSVTSIGEKAFRGCTGLASITIPSSVTSFYKAFADCENLASITFQKGTTSICDGACANCTGLTSVTIPNTVTRIGDWAFAGCTNLTSISIPNSVTSIGETAFSACTGLTSITIPESVTSVGGGAFAGCTGLTSITIPQSVTSVGEAVLGACTNLTNIVVAEGNGKYDSRDNCNAIIETASNTLIAACSNSTIPNGVTRIGGNAFSGCTGLTSISIPNSVTTIDGYAFAYCTGLTSVVIPNGVTSIGEGSFSACTSLTSVTIPSSVTTIGEKAFFDSYNLTSVTIPSSVTSIGNEAFGRSSAFLPSCNVVYEADGNALPDQGDSFSSSTPSNVEFIKNYQERNGKTYIPNNATKGIFSVGYSQQVSFAKGNLQYQASSGMWRFANNQWETMGQGNVNISANYSGWIDLFGWGTGNGPLNHSENNNDYSTFCDWGSYGMGDGWRTPTLEEWDYLFTGRSDAYNKYGAAIVNGVAGIVVLPDDWVMPSGLSFKHSFDYSQNTYDNASWSKMEEAGAVFLPAAGRRTGNGIYNHGNDCDYWSSTPNGSTKAFNVDLTKGKKLIPRDDSPRKHGFAVRLIKNI